MREKLKTIGFALVNGYWEQVVDFCWDHFEETGKLRICFYKGSDELYSTDIYPIGQHLGDDIRTFQTSKELDEIDGWGWAYPTLVT